MKIRFQYLVIIIFSFIVLSSCADNTSKKLLIVYRPSNASTKILQSLKQISGKNNIPYDTTSNIGFVTEDTLKKYSSLFIVDYFMDTLSYSQQPDLQRFVEAGGTFMIFSERPDTILNWPWMSRNAANFSRIDSGSVADNFKQGKLPDYSKAGTLRISDENRFVVEVLDTYLYEPMEMVVFKDGRVLYIERRGDIKIYDPGTKKSRVIAKFDVSITGNYEDGILGVTLDPDFEKNNWIYINYSPAGNVPKQNVSRFVMKGDSILRETEKIVLEIPTQRETCCHSGGHLTFGPDKDLYISTGDNTSSKESDGFSPIDERQGRAPFDAQKSSGNTHDLRGKILRIHPEVNGTYSIPDGNLFPIDGSKGKPEIYVMGTRNAFRFSVDQHNGILYWGDVGPDGGEDTDRGPQSYDEFNQAKTPGNYGWPYFVADNKAYADFDFATNKIGPKFDPNHPVNMSPNNTGSRELPPARKPMIWYPYGVSKEFPSLGTGSRSAMAGPVYYKSDFKDAKNPFPDDYDGKLFIYEWARSWVKVVSFDENKTLNKIEPFLPAQQWYKPIDMKFGPDGSLYVLQYGENYFEHNQDSRLVKITYVKGNRDPKADLTADKTVGGTPLTVHLSAEKSFDLDQKAELKYSWEIPGSDAQKINGKTATVTYNKPGVYRPVVKVTDNEGKSSTAEVIVKVGNEIPSIAIDVKSSNKTFYFDNEKIPYSVQVNDKEDGSVGNGIDPSAVFVSFDYLQDGKDLALLESNANLATALKFVNGKHLLETSDCKTCHNPEKTSIGPSFLAIAQRYKGKDVADQLAAKIIAGGNGNWGKNMMAAHPQHSEEDAKKMAEYILSFSTKQTSLPVSGQVVFNAKAGNQSAGNYILRAIYTDKGGPVTGNLTGTRIFIFRNQKVQAEDFILDKKMDIVRPDGMNMTLVGNIGNNTYMTLKDIDLTGIGHLQVDMGSLEKGSVMEMHTGSPDGPLIAQCDIANTTPGKPAMKHVNISLKQVSGRHDLYVVFKNNSGVFENIAFIDWMRFSK
ncbi:MAG TPA: PQQ-dependent sugar dehydrogenase [Flavitalea sp.]|nr:PQQ-dependent sugar dehydrogenase [Flavitalea sp.]